MSRLDWHPRYHRDALEGMRGLTLEDRGAYTTLLDLMYDRAGGVPDDERFIAGWLGCSVRLWRSIRDRLIQAGKLTVEKGLSGDVLMNARVRLELDSQANRSRVNAESGANGGRKSAQKRAKPKENNDNHEAVAQAPLNLKTETETEGSEDKSSDAVRVVVDHDKAAWDQAVDVLTRQGGIPEKQARSAFGKMLGANGLRAKDMLPSVAAAAVSETQDPLAYLTRCAQAIAKRGVEAAKPKRVAWV
ncbi:DUF1376 domain-containing protein [Brevundimonas vesicularis]|uniref:DUF1376 domain-containing protein n=1 Tax=Brevundimonas vesicularis TaxID=41276 RepID=UPI003850DA13